MLAIIFAFVIILAAPAADAQWRDGIPVEELSEESRARIASRSADALMRLVSEVLSEEDHTNMEHDESHPKRVTAMLSQTASGELVRTWLIPFIPHIPGLQGFFSIENDLLTTQDVVWVIVDDQGDFTRLVQVSLPQKSVQYLNSYDLLHGNPEKRVTIVTTYKNAPEGAEYAVVVTQTERVFLRAFLRTSDGFVTGMSRTAGRFVDPSTRKEFEVISFFNPASNVHIRSVLRIGEYFFARSLELRMASSLE